jgi:Lon protease-like protein
MVETLPVSFHRPIPIFPLPNCVLLPQNVLPLHIFEPRYRQMTREALDSYGLIAMALFEGEAWKRDYEGRPPVRPIVCVGYIIEHERLEDENYDLLLLGLFRARIRNEVPSAPYRKAFLEPRETVALPEAALAEERQRIENLFQDSGLDAVEAVTTLRQVVDRRVPTAALVDLSLGALCDDVEERYRALAEEDPRARARRLEVRLEELRRDRS